MKLTKPLNRDIPYWLREANAVFSVFNDAYPFQDDIWGMVQLSQFERNIVDTPEFQRLFRVSQMGFVDHVFAPANHTRALHSIGACGVAKLLCSHLEHNTLRQTHHNPQSNPLITFTSSVLISAAALLHDLTHLPFSHDVERRNHHIFLSDDADRPARVSSFLGPYVKHDDYRNNPTLYIAFFDTRRSGLARVLRGYSPLFWKLLETEARKYGDCELTKFHKLAAGSGWPNRENEVLQQLLFHLVVGEKPSSFEKGMIATATDWLPDGSCGVKTWGLGPEEADASLREGLHSAWYRPYRHDIVGNTVSADLLDYLARDSHRLGIERQPDLYFLNFYVLAADDVAGSRAVLDLDDPKRRTIRTGVINDLFRLLDLRFEIHERAVFHRVTQACVAMLWRVMGTEPQNKPPLKEILGWSGDTVALGGDDHFLTKLLDYTKRKSPTPNFGAERLLKKVIERRVYKPLIVIAGNKLEDLLDGTSFTNRDPKRFCTPGSNSDQTYEEQHYRLMPALVDSGFYAPLLNYASSCIEKLLKHTVDDIDSLRKLEQAGLSLSKRVIFWAPPYKQLVKDPEVLFRADGKIIRLEECTTGASYGSLGDVCATGLKYFEERYRGLWSIYVFVSDGLYYCGLMSKLFGATVCDKTKHETHLRQASVLAMAALRGIWQHFAQEILVNRETGADVRDWLSTEFATSPAVGSEARKKQIRYFWDSVDTLQKRTLARLEKISGMDVSLYAHGPGHDPWSKAFSNCRDVRYKFDEEIGINEARQMGLVMFDEKGAKSELLKSLVKTTKLSVEEWREVSDVLEQVSDEELTRDYSQVARGDTETAELFKTIWNKAL
jgi:HD superfamily phosphohydrolase